MGKELVAQRLVADGLDVRRDCFAPHASGFPVDLFGDGFDWGLFTGQFRHDLLFIDIETCGLGDTVIFLVGMLRYRSGGERPCLEFESVLARDPSVEPALLRHVAGSVCATPYYVSFNGKSFDLPRLRNRARRHRVEVLFEAFVDVPAERHIDLLIEVRRRWKGELPNCRLSTVERRLLGLERADDIPGREVPARYWDAVTTGQAHLVEPIREHNRRDVFAMVALLSRLRASTSDLRPLTAKP